MQTTEGTLGGSARIISALVWPFTLCIILWFVREPLERLLIALVNLAEAANKIKIWQVEIDRDIDRELDRTAMRASHVDLSQVDVPKEEVDAAQRVGSLVSRLPMSFSKEELIDSVKQKMLGLAQEYETTRANMPAGSERTRAMNSIVARMRALAIPAKGFLKDLSGSRESPGKRLAALAILQIAPDFDYLDWLVARMSVEQPFVLFHASQALLAAVRAFGSTRGEQLNDALQISLQVIKNHSRPDSNTIITLESALSELKAIQ